MYRGNFKMRRLYYMVGMSILICNAASAFDNISFKGYLRATPMLWKPSPVYMTGDTDRRMNILFHTRQNLRWYATESVTADLEIKTRMYTGESSDDLQYSADFTLPGGTLFDWEKVFVEEEKTVLKSEIDRAWLDWYSGNFQLTLGRQRIAWGTNLVWNPIDLFNPSNPLDFDNEEMPGSDAVRIQYYLGPASKVEFAVSPQDESDETTGAVQLILNSWEYDWVFIVGRRDIETVGGFAWAGHIKGGGFRGEVLYSKPRADYPYSEGYFNYSISGDYTFKNSLYLQTSLLYNERGTTGNGGGAELLNAYYRRDFSSSRISIFGQAAKDITPLVRANISGIVNPYDNSWYIGPNITWSVLTNLDFTGMGMIFGGDPGTEYGGNSEILMARLKWSF